MRPSRVSPNELAHQSLAANRGLNAAQATPTGKKEKAEKSANSPKTPANEASKVNIKSPMDDKKVTIESATKNKKFDELVDFYAQKLARAAKRAETQEAQTKITNPNRITVQPDQ